MPIKIGTARAWGRLRDLFDLKGKHELQLDEIIVPVVIVENVADELKEGNLGQAQGGRAQAAAVGFIGQVQLFNPVGSGRMYELYQAVMNGGVNQVFDMGPVTAAIATSNFGQWQDRRLTGLPTGDIQGQSTVAAPALVNAVPLRVVGSDHGIIELKVTLPPGTGYMVEGSVQDQLIHIGFFWRERAATSSELAAL